MATKLAYELRAPGQYDADKLSDITGLRCPEPTLTQQQFQKEADINHIAEQFGLTGEMPQLLRIPTAGDFEGIFDYQTAMNTIVEADRAFMTLPAKLRARFENDPAQLLDFLHDEENRDEAIRLGLVPKPSVESLITATAAPGPSGKGETPTPEQTAPEATPKQETRKTGKN